MRPSATPEQPRQALRAARELRSVPWEGDGGLEDVPDLLRASCQDRAQGAGAAKREEAARIRGKAADDRKAAADAMANAKAEEVGAAAQEQDAKVAEEIAKAPAPRSSAGGGSRRWSPPTSARSRTTLPPTRSKPSTAGSRTRVSG
jgi:hypothetical protein